MMGLLRSLFSKKAPKGRAPKGGEPKKPMPKEAIYEPALRSYAVDCYRRRMELFEEKMAFFNRRFDALSRGDGGTDMETLMQEDRAMDFEAMYEDGQQVFMDMAFTMYHHAGHDLEHGRLSEEQARTIRDKIYPSTE